MSGLWSRASSVAIMQRRRLHCLQQPVHSQSYISNIMQKRSALTAALSGQPDAHSSAEPSLAKKLDPGAFPCIREDGAESVSEAMEKLEVGALSTIGSVPTAVLSNGSSAAGRVLHTSSAGRLYLRRF